MTKGAFNRSIFCIVIFLFSAVQLSAQKKRSISESTNRKIQKYTTMEKFEPTLVTSVEERERMKKERLERAKFRKNVIDTMDITNRKRTRLLKELKKNPFSDRIDKAFAEIEFEETQELINQDN